MQKETTTQLSVASGSYQKYETERWTDGDRDDSFRVMPRQVFNLGQQKTFRPEKTLCIKHLVTGFKVSVVFFLILHVHYTVKSRMKCLTQRFN